MNTVNTVHVYDLAIQIEQKVSQLYSRFSTLFRSDLQASRFWTQLAHHEKAHAEALMRGKVSFLGGALGKGKDEKSTVENSAELEGIFEKIREHERTVRKQRLTLQEALEIMLEIESGEIHHVYSGLVQSPGGSCPSPKEHARMIKEFLSRTPAGTSLVPQGVSLLGMAGTIPEPRPVVVPKKPEPAPRPHPPTRELKPSRSGKIVEVEPSMGYGMIEGEDGRRYLFLLGKERHDLPEKELLTPGLEVRFDWKDFPWGPRALRIRGR